MSTCRWLSKTNVSCNPTRPSSPSTLFDKTANWFERAKAALLDDLPCRRGCDRCCSGLFPVTLLDQQEIRRGLRSLPYDRHHAIEQKAIQQVSMISAAVPRLARNCFIDQWRDQDIDQLVEQYRDLPCPALQSDGSCGIYAFRPLTCRSMGIPQEEEGIVHGACAVQTSVPVIRLPRPLRREEDLLARMEAEDLAHLRRQQHAQGEELLLPYVFIPAAGEVQKPSRRPRQRL